MMIRTRAMCRECGRAFDLLDLDEAMEWAAGHDCEEPPERATEAQGWDLTTGDAVTDNRLATGALAPTTDSTATCEEVR